MAQNRPARQVPHSPGQRPGRWGDIKGNCALQGQNHQTCPKGVLSPLCYALALGFAAFVEKELVRFRNSVEKESISFVAELPLWGVLCHHQHHCQFNNQNAPKGLNHIAQGNALGDCQPRITCALQGQHHYQSLNTYLSSYSIPYSFKNCKYSS